MGGGGGGTLHVCVGVWCWLLLFMVFGVGCNFSLVTRLHYTYCTILCVCGGGERLSTALQYRGYTRGELEKAKGVKWGDRQEVQDRMDEKARVRKQEGGAGGGKMCVWRECVCFCVCARACQQASERARESKRKGERQREWGEGGLNQ
eukprot:Tamp_24178.p1 GENE.Tamp_24178~~Tamp_24178.p1  ORF type:complete len:148 (+),score=16.64 Tamp_24178:183-626(+)